MIRVIKLCIMHCALCIILASCSKTIYVPTERQVCITDSVKSASVRSDSVILRDSVSIDRGGDTIVITKIRYRDRVSTVHDTLYRTIRDSVFVSEPSRTVVERLKKNYKYDMIKAIIALMTLVAIIFLAGKLKK